MSGEPLPHHVRFRNVAGSRLAGNLKKKRIGQFYCERPHRPSVIQFQQDRNTTRRPLTLLPESWELSISCPPYLTALPFLRKLPLFTAPVAQLDRASDYGSTQNVLRSFAKRVFHRWNHSAMAQMCSVVLHHFSRNRARAYKSTRRNGVNRPLGQAIAFRELCHLFTSIDDDENFTFIA